MVITLGFMKTTKSASILAELHEIGAILQDPPLRARYMPMARDGGSTIGITGDRKMFVIAAKRYFFRAVSR